MILKAYELGMSGIALTDHETVAGHVEWLKCEKELKKAGKIPEDFKCACGNEIYLVDSRENIERYWHFILVAKNTDGHRALRELSSTAWYNGFSSRGMMRVPTEKAELEAIVRKYPNTLIASTACLGGHLPHFVAELVKAEQAQDENEIRKWKMEIHKFMTWNIDLFGDDFYIEIAAANVKDQIRFNERVKSIAAYYKRKVVIGSDAHYLTAKERSVHKAYLNSKDGEREVDGFYTFAHMMDNEEAFENLKINHTEEEFAEFCANSMEIYDKIGTYDIFRKPIIPRVDVRDYDKHIPADITVVYPTLYQLFTSDNVQERYWVNECFNALEAKNLINATYLNTLETEARVIKVVGEKLGNCLYEYFNTFQHMINLFWDCGSIVGPRGSAVCFLSNYLLGITQLDPLKWNLRFWRFLNEERVELPDIDIDLTPSKRAAVFSALRKERGELNVIQVCTYGTEGTRSAIAAACFKKCTLVKTINGEKPIEEILPGDRVYTTNGWEEVIAPTEIKGTQLINLKTRYSTNPILSCTPEHEILCLPANEHKGRINGNWNKEKTFSLFPELRKLKSSSLIYQTYYNYCKNIVPEWRTARDFTKYDYALQKIETKVDNSSYITWKNEVQRKYGYGLPEKIKIDNDFCELIGIWLAEGSYNGQSICFTINQKEENLRNRILQLMWNVFQLDNFQIYNRKDSQAQNISFASKQLVAFFSQLFEVDSITEVNQWNKYVPRKLLYILPKIQLQIFKGWFLGDGYARTSRNGERQSAEARGTTVSKQLAEDMSFILRRNYINPTIIVEHRKDKKTTYNVQLYSKKADKLYDLKYLLIDYQDVFEFKIEDRGEMDFPVYYKEETYLKAKIEEIDREDIDDKVYCLVTPSHSFTVNNIIVHNCRGYRSEWYPDGIDTDTAQYLSSLIPQERGFLWSIHDAVYGNEEKGRAPITALVNELDKYPGLLEIIESIDGSKKKLALKHLFH